VQEIITSGAWGDSQIDDYMEAIIGQEVWDKALEAANGSKKEASEQIWKDYGITGTSDAA